MNVAFMASPGLALTLCHRNLPSLAPRGQSPGGTIRVALNSTPPSPRGTMPSVMVADNTLDPGLRERERVLEELRAAAPRLRARGIAH